MAARKKAADEATVEEQKDNEAEVQECFIIMPIADRDGYEPGHFKRVYDWIIKPACEAAGYKPVRADDVSSSNFIVADILKRIVEAPMTICDISSLNANVMFELGIRQAFGKPVTLIKDEKTRSVFDISGLRYTEYSSSLRADLVRDNVAKVAQMIVDTGSPDSGVTSLMSLVDIDSAELPEKKEVSADTRLILSELHKLVNNTSIKPTLNLKKENRDEGKSRVTLSSHDNKLLMSMHRNFKAWVIKKFGIITISNVQFLDDEVVYDFNVSIQRASEITQAFESINEGFDNDLWFSVQPTFL